ncbi:AAA family ATPase, partial [Mycobacteroides chelonae]
MILRQIAIDREKQPDAWYLEIPAIAQIAREPLRLTTGVTVIVGENGSGKSTFLEAVASSWRSRLPYAVNH